jgi:hypothetical protein
VDTEAEDHAYDALRYGLTRKVIRFDVSASSSFRTHELANHFGVEFTVTPEPRQRCRKARSAVLTCSESQTQGCENVMLRLARKLSANGSQRATIGRVHFETTA